MDVHCSLCRCIKIIIAVIAIIIWDVSTLHMFQVPWSTQRLLGESVEKSESTLPVLPGPSHPASLGLILLVIFMIAFCMSKQAAGFVLGKILIVLHNGFTLLESTSSQVWTSVMSSHY